jgi:acetolactate synthase-1/2/3 large subunit
MPYGVDQAIAILAGTRNLVLAGAAIPAAPFAYPGKPGALAPDDATIHVLARPDQDVAQALAALAEELSVTKSIAAEVERPGAVTAGASRAPLASRRPRQRTWSSLLICCRPPTNAAGRS